MYDHNPGHNLANHIEGHVAAILRIKAITSGIGRLYINIPPCGMDWSGKGVWKNQGQKHFCNENLEYMLPERVTLEVIWGAPSKKTVYWSTRLIILLNASIIKNSSNKLYIL